MIRCLRCVAPYVPALAFLMMQTVGVASEQHPIALTIDRSAPVEIERIDAPFEMPLLGRPVFRNALFDVRDYGAIGNGETRNTQAFGEAIEACSAAGGGRVLIPKGRWFTGPIHLRSGVELHLQEGAELHFSDDPEDYLPVVLTRWAGFELYNYSPLIYARDCRDIAISGSGRLFGHGRRWWSWKARQAETCLVVYHDQVLKGVPPGERIYGTAEAGLRPQFINMVNCTNVLLEGFTIASPGPFWTIHPYLCENVVIRGLYIDTHVDHSTTGVDGPNTDGIDIDSCRNVLVEYCHINAGDDCIAVKSGINEDGWRVGRPSENVVIRHVWGGHCHGGIVIGSDTSGGIRNLLAQDCEFVGADRGIRLKSNASRGGVVEGLWYQDIRMRDIRREAIVINTDYGAWLADEHGTAYPVFRQMSIRDVTCDGAGVALHVVGTRQQPVEDITMENVSIRASTGMTFEWVDGLQLIDCSGETPEGNVLVLKNCQDILQQTARVLSTPQGRAQGAAPEPPPAAADREPSETMNTKAESEAPADGGGR